MQNGDEVDEDVIASTVLAKLFLFLFLQVIVAPLYAWGDGLWDFIHNSTVMSGMYFGLLEGAVLILVSTLRVSTPGLKANDWQIAIGGNCLTIFTIVISGFMFTLDREKEIFRYGVNAVFLVIGSVLFLVKTIVSRKVRWLVGSSIGLALAQFWY